MEDYSEYLIQGEPDKRDRVRNWMAAIGLQDVDGLTPSNYMLETVRRNIEGEITIDEVSRLVDDGIKKQLDKLKKAGIIRHVGATKKGHWEII